MDANIAIAPGFPYELLGLLRRMPGIEDLNLLQDSDRFAQNFEKSYPDKTEYINLLNTACKLGVIAEMASIIDEPMWRKRSFINKSIIQLMTNNRMKEYQACEILESFMQIFGWDFEVKVARRWETSEEDTSEHHKSINGGTHVAKKVVEKADEDKKAANKSNKIIEQNEAPTNEANNKTADNAGSTKVENGKNPKNTTNMYNANGVYDSHEIKADSNKQSQEHVNLKLNSQIKPTDLKGQNQPGKDIAYLQKQTDSQSNEPVVYADEENIYDRDAYIKNEILKGGIKFENLMSNAIKQNVRSAIRGNSDAQYRMGKYYAEPNTKHTDYEEALKWYRVSASQGNKKAQFELGMLYDGGKVKCKDYKKQAMKCYLGLAESGFPTAQCMVGMKYKFGDGVDEDINEAIKWFKKAAAQGHTDAQRNLGDTYMAIGKKKEAMKWYERAAAAGDAYCEKMLGNR